MPRPLGGVVYLTEFFNYPPIPNAGGLGRLPLPRPRDHLRILVETRPVSRHRV